MMGSRWPLFVTIVVIHFVACTGQGVGTQCWSCEYNASACQDSGQRYIPDVATEADFCKRLRNVTYIVRDLCAAYPEGYQVLCQRGDHSEISCKDSGICRPVEPAFQTGGNAAYRLSSSATLVSILVATLVILTQSCLTATAHGWCLTTSSRA